MTLELAAEYTIKQYTVEGTINTFKDSERSLTAIDRHRVESSGWLL